MLKNCLKNLKAISQNYFPNWSLNSRIFLLAPLTISASFVNFRASPFKSHATVITVIFPPSHAMPPSLLLFWTTCHCHELFINSHFFTSLGRTTLWCNFDAKLNIYVSLFVPPIPPFKGRGKRSKSNFRCRSMIQWYSFKWFNCIILFSRVHFHTHYDPTWQFNNL